MKKKSLKLHIIHRKDEYVKFRKCETKIKSPFMIDADSGSILVPEDNVKQNQKEDYANKYQKHIGCSYVNKLFCVDDNFVRHA